MKAKASSVVNATVADADATVVGVNATATATDVQSTNTQATVETAAMKNNQADVNAPATPAATPAAVAPFNPASIVTTILRPMTSVTLTDYLEAHRNALAQAVHDNLIHSFCATLLQKGFARVLTENNTLFNALTSDDAKLTHLSTLWTYIEAGCLTASAYKDLTQPKAAPATKAPRSKRTSRNRFTLIAEELMLMSQGADVELTDRASYHKMAEALSRPDAEQMYNLLLNVPKAAPILAAAEATVTNRMAAEAEAAEAAAAIEAERVAAELTSIFG